MKLISISPPNEPIRAELKINGSKSITNRLLLLREVLHLNFTLQNGSDSEDSKLLQKSLNELREGKSSHFDLNHAGTSFRFLLAYLCNQPGTFTLTGSERLKERPISELVNALRTLGANIEYLEKEFYPPLKITGSQLSGKKLKIDSSISSQFISALLLIALGLSSDLEIELEGNRVSSPYIRMTIELLKTFNLTINYDGKRINTSPPHFPSVPFHSFAIESDWSSASYFYSVVALSPNSEIHLQSFYSDSLQADSALVDMYSQLGVSTEFLDEKIILKHVPVLSKGFEHDFTNCPDIATTIACTCLGLGLNASLKGLKTLQLKESRRIDVLQSELKKLGAVIEHCDHSSLRFLSPSLQPQQTNSIETFNDHRIAMSFAPLCLRFPNLTLQNPDVVNKSYPGFWKDLQSLGFHLNLLS